MTDILLRELVIPIPADSWTTIQRLLRPQSNPRQVSGHLEARAPDAQAAEAARLDLFALVLSLSEDEWCGEAAICEKLDVQVLGVLGAELTKRDQDTRYDEASAQARLRWFARRLCALVVEVLGDRYVEVRGVTRSLRLIHDPAHRD